jgi:hypothetical protein
MKKLKLSPESLTVETFEASDYPHVVSLDTTAPPCWETLQTTASPWMCAVYCEN